MPFRRPVLALHNRPRSVVPGAPGPESDAGVLEEVAAVTDALSRLGVPFRVADAASLPEALDAVLAGPEAIIFNLVEGFAEEPLDCCLVPAVCRATGRACTGSDSICLALALDKWRARAVLRTAGVPVAPASLIRPGERPRPGRFWRGPFIVKPLQADASEGIHAERSVVPRAGEALERAVACIHEEFGQPALVERYIDGRELNVSLIERRGVVEVLAIAEIDFSAFAPDRPRVVDYAAKWLPDTFEYQNTPRILPAPLEPRIETRVRRLALAAWRALGCSDYARVDFRLDPQGGLWALEVNPNPDISPGGGFAAAVEYAGLGYVRFVRNCLRNARAASAARVAPSRAAADTGVGARE